jgi:hypothetical protein
MAIYDFFLSRNSSTITANTYIGHEGRLFYDDATGEIRISDGVTPGGLPIPITIATTATPGAIRAGQGFTVGASGLLSLNAGPMFELDGTDTFQLKVATETRLGGVKLGPGVTVNDQDQIIIDSEGLDFSFGDFAATVGTYTDTTEYAVLSSINDDQDIVFASNGEGSVCVVGEFHVHPTNGDLTDTLEGEASFIVKADGQVEIRVTQLDAQAGAIEIIGSDLGGIVPPGIDGTMLHITGQSADPCRLYFDGNGDYVSIVGRRWNGNLTAGRTQVLAGQDVMRINATAQTNASMGNVSLAQISFTALENQTTTAQGSEITFTVTPVGSPATSRVDVLTVRSTGIELPTAGTTVKLSGSTSGNITLQANAIAGTTAITLPATTGTVITTGDTGTVTNTILAGNIANNKLANSTISGISLGSNLAALSAGNYLTGTDYTGATVRTFAVDATTTATASKVVARDANAVIAGSNFQGTVRDLGTVAAGAGDEITINFATDHIVRCTYSTEPIEVGFSNYIAGKTVTLIARNTSGANRQLDIGIAAANTQGDATIDVNEGSTAIVTYYCTGTTIDDVFASTVFAAF